MRTSFRLGHETIEVLNDVSCTDRLQLCWRQNGDIDAFSVGSVAPEQNEETSSEQLLIHEQEILLIYVCVRARVCRRANREGFAHGELLERLKTDGREVPD